MLQLIKEKESIFFLYKILKGINFDAELIDLYDQNSYENYSMVNLVYFMLGFYKQIKIKIIKIVYILC